MHRLYAAEDGTALRRYDFAHGKAYGAMAMGLHIGPRLRMNLFFSIFDFISRLRDQPPQPGRPEPRNTRPEDWR